MAGEKIETACPTCGRVQKYDPAGRGRKGRCRGCNTAYTIGAGTPWIPHGEPTVEAAVPPVEAAIPTIEAAAPVESGEPTTCGVCSRAIPAGQPGGMCGDCFDRGIATKESRCHVDRGGCGQRISVGDWRSEGGLCLDCFVRKSAEAEAEKDASAAEPGTDEPTARCTDCRQEFAESKIEDGVCEDCRRARESARASRDDVLPKKPRRPRRRLR